MNTVLLLLCLLFFLAVGFEIKIAVVKIKVKFSLKQAMNAQMWSRGIALLFL
jgi:hypothetical protein